MTDPRQRQISAVSKTANFDVIVIGGGINGIGTFRELAMQGLSVLLVERDDFCSGCSSALSRMIHGGLRYLENGEFDLVRESLRERDALLRNAPHVVRPLPTLVPIASITSGLLNGAMSFFGMESSPKSRGLLSVKLGLTLYDLIARKRRSLPRHKIVGKAEAFRDWPDITKELRFCAVYHDAWISNPERLGIELILDGQAANPQAISLNYAELQRGEGNSFKLRDLEKGATIEVTTKALVVATGAWVDETLTELAETKPLSLVAGTKGSHLVLDNPALHSALRGHMVLYDNVDGRVCIVFPYLGRVLAGATDIFVEQASRVKCEDSERDYILRSLELVFPSVSVSAKDIVYSFSGIRPLPRSEKGFTGRITRGHHIHRIEGAVPQFCMIGGKWTTFRAFAEQTTDAVLAALGRKRRCSTEDTPIGGGLNFDSDIAARLVTSGLTQIQALRLANIYGSRAFEVAAFCDRYSDMTLPGGELTSGEVAFLVQVEMARRLPNIFQRRQPIAIKGQLNCPLIEAAAAEMKRQLGWSAKRTSDEIESFIDELSSFHGVTIDRSRKE
jgi:glycerol-3-phosphate dehydrogenase